MNTNGTNNAAEISAVDTYRITNPRWRMTSRSGTGSWTTVTGGRQAPRLATSSSAAPAMPSTT